MEHRIADEDKPLLDAVPDTFCLAAPFLKARPSVESDVRILYMEASTPDSDLDGESILQSALRESAPYYLERGNVDIDHLTLIGHKIPTIKNPYEWEIGQPVDVKFGGQGSTFLKSRIYQGAERADWFWSTIADQKPPTRWFPSVGGHTLSKGIVVDHKTGRKQAVIRKVRWVNTAVSKESVNHHVAGVSTQPLGAFAKAYGPAIVGGSDRYEMIAATPCSGGCAKCGACAKALTAGYGTDSATLTGGAAMRTESLDPQVARWTQGDGDEGEYQRLAASYLRDLKANSRPVPRSVSDVRGFFESNGTTRDRALKYAARWITELSRAIRRNH